MKKLRVLLLVAVVITSTAMGNAQGRYGKDSVQCIQSLSFYSDYMKQNNFNEAAPTWRDAIKYCPPGLRQTLYMDGIKIFSHFIDNKINPEKRDAYLDSLFTMYDLRIQYFPNNALSAKSFKLYDYMKYEIDVEKKYALAKEIVEMGKDKVDPRIMVYAMQDGSELATAGKIGAEELFNLYSSFSQILDAQIHASVEEAAGVKNAVDHLFAVSGIASCENIIPLFTPKFEAEPNNLDLVKTIVGLLSNAGCLESDLFLKTVEAYNNMEPSYNSMYFLFRLYSSKGDHANAIKMLQGAIDSEESNTEEDARLLVDGATYYLKNMSNYAKAIEFAKLGMSKSKAQEGKANFIIGSAWGAMQCNAGNEVERVAKYWVAVDYMNRAKNADQTLADDANSSIRLYSSQFPQQEEAFMYDLVDGASYTVSCGGLRETTTVRTRK